MDTASLKKLFEQVKRGKVSPMKRCQRLRHLPFEDLGFANVDHHRACGGMPEIIFGPGKTPEQLAEIFARLRSMARNDVGHAGFAGAVSRGERKFRKPIS